MRSRIPALSIWRPWTTLILHYRKDVENRLWSTQYRGPLYIHGAQKVQTSAYRVAHEYGIGLAPDPDAHPMGILGLVDLVDVCDVTVAAREAGMCDCNERWAILGHCHWRLDNPRPFPEPVPCRGAQGLWYPTGQTLDALLEVARGA